MNKVKSNINSIIHKIALKKKAIQESLDLEEIEIKEKEPLTVRDYKWAYYYSTMTLIILILVVILIGVLYMAHNDIDAADLIPQRVKDLQSSRYVQKVVGLIRDFFH